MRDTTRGLFVLGAAVAVGLPLWFEFVLDKRYSGPNLWPGMVGNFTASFAAFLLALAWDRRQRQQEREQEETARAAELERETENERGRRATDARRLLEIVVVELAHNRKVVRTFATTTVGMAPLADHLRTGAWARSADVLSRILSRPDLIAKASGLYDRLAELQWRLRFVAEASGSAYRQNELPDVINQTDLLARSIDKDFDEIHELLKRQAESPDVDLLGIRREIAASISATSTVTASLSVARPTATAD
jgi:hypothetical protein